MAPANFSRLKKSVIALINANPGVYADTVSGRVGRYPSDDEIRDAILKRDAELCIAALETPDHWHRTAFTPTLSNVLNSGGALPAQQGAISDVVYSADNTTYLPSLIGESREQIIQTRQQYLNYGKTLADIAGFHWLENNRLYHTSPSAKVNFYTFTIGSNPQSPDIWEDALAHGAAATLQKDGGAQPELFQTSEQKFQNKISEIRSYPSPVSVQTAYAKASQ